MSFSSTSSTCQLCSQQPQKYCCPRCNILYCSIDCYKSQKHSQCSEAFYKDCVIEEMAMQSANRNQQQRCGTLDDIPGLSDDIKRMYAILKRMESHESNTSDIEDFDFDEDDFDVDDDKLADIDLSTRLTGIDLNNADAIWSKLTCNEKQEFEEIAKSDDVSKLIPPYEPWWTKKNLIEDISEAASISHTETPEILANIADFAKISSKPPADCVKHNLKNVLAAYALTVRFFNGDYSLSTHEFSNYFITTCANLKSNSNFDDESIAIQSVVHNCRTEGLSINDGQVKLLYKDVELISQCVSHILAALSDIHRLLTLAKRNKFVRRSASNTSDFTRRFFDHEIVNFENLSKTKLSASIKKIEYYLSFVAKHKDNLFG